jgi:hypothetical protein
MISIKKYKKKMLIGIPLLISFGFIYYVLISPIVLPIVLPLAKEYLNRIPFDSAKWQDQSLVKSDNPIRIRMVNDLLNRYNFHGMGREEVIAVLGRPDDVEQVSTEPEALKGWDMAYWLGPEPIRHFDAKWLVFRIDAVGRISEFRVVKD